MVLDGPFGSRSRLVKGRVPTCEWLSRPGLLKAARTLPHCSYPGLLAAGGSSCRISTSYGKRSVRRGPVAWIAIRSDLHAPGLLALGLDPARLLIIEPANRRMALWAFEECLRTRRLAAALAEIDHLALVESRRLQLAAEAHGVAAIVLRAYGAGKTMAKAEASAARTRWRVAAITSRACEGVGAPCWRVTLAHCRGGRSGEWIVEQQAKTWRVVDDAVAAAPEARALAG